MARKRYDVSPDGDDWKLTTGGKTVRKFDTKEPAVQAGAKQARREPGKSQLVIHRKDGTIEDERTYKKDPYPPKG
jgi:Uncharacterized protein conserved in bacteria (DUF2188)